MAWGFSGTRWANGYAISATDSALIAGDIQTAGGNRDSGRYGLPNAGFLTLVPGALPGTSYTVTGASWAASLATLTIGTHVIQVGQHFSLAGVTPAGYNGADLVATAVTGTTVSYALTSNPGAWSSGGTLFAAGVSAANGMLAVDSSGVLWLRQAGAWVNPMNLGGLVVSPFVIGDGSGDNYTLARDGPTGFFKFTPTQNTFSGYIFQTVTGGVTTEVVRITNTGSVGISTPTPHSPLAVVGLPSYANNAAAITGGLTAGDFYVVTSSNPRAVAVVF